LARLALADSMSEGAGGEGRPPPPDSSKTPWQIRAKKVREKFKKRNKKKTKNKIVQHAYPVSQAMCAGFAEKGFEIW